MPFRTKQGLIRPHNSKINAFFRLFDVLIITITLWAITDLYHTEWGRSYTLWLLLAIVSFQFFAELNDVYRKMRGMQLIQEWRQLILAWAGVFIVFIIAQQFEPIENELNQLIFWSWFAAVPIELLSWHIIVKTLFNFYRKKGDNSRKVAIIGATELGKKLKETFSEESWMGLKFIGFYDDRQIYAENRMTVNNGELVGDIDELIEKAIHGKVDQIYITLALSAEHRIKEIIARLSDTTVSVFFVPDFFVFDLLRSRWLNLDGILAVSIFDTPFYGVDGLAKRVLDLMLACIILVIITLPMLLIAITIKLTSRGPVLFKQSRYGFGGQKIEVWKFRSMKVCQNEDNVPQATKNDPRITRFGAFLRKTSLDEFPQFFNVIQGRMSIVGPRPHAVSHNEYYRKKVPGYMLRHKVKPGITGLAQISGFRGETETLDKMEGRIKFDLEYITNWSIWLDIKIVLLTIVRGFVGNNAY